MNGVDPLETYRERVVWLQAELERPMSQLARDRERLRTEIVGLFREVELQIAGLQALKEDLRPLVDRYREIFARAEAASPLARVDHLGSSTYRERGWSALAGADYDRAVVELEKALSMDPDNPSNLSMLAWAFLRLREWEKGRGLLERVLDMEPTHALARTCAGYLQLRESKFAEAIESLAGVAREGTDRTATMYANLYLGIVYAERDMHRDAQSFFRRALELGPNLTEAYWEMGRAHQREGRDDLALDAWKAGAANRYNPWGERCRTGAERLEGTGVG